MNGIEPMNAHSLRRFLQPPEKLRFPVAAPLILGTVCALVLFVTFLAEVLFPFADGLITAAEAGATAIIQPGGSKNDQAVISACNASNVPMIFTGRRHFKH